MQCFSLVQGRTAPVVHRGERNHLVFLRYFVFLPNNLDMNFLYSVERSKFEYNIKYVALF